MTEHQGIPDGDAMVEVYDVQTDELVLAPKSLADRAEPPHGDGGDGAHKRAVARIEAAGPIGNGRWRESLVERQLNDEMRDKAPELYRRLIVERNHRFASAIATLVHGDKSVLVAIGDGHLVGADSVETDLAAMGIHAERVDANAKGAPAK